MILMLLSHITAVRILFVIGIAVIALPIIFSAAKKNTGDTLKKIRSIGIYAGILMCLPMIYYFYADIRYDVGDFSENDKLYLCAENKNLKAAEKFIENGALPDGYNRYGKSAVYRSVELEDAEMTELFVQSGINVNYCGSASKTLIALAAEKGNTQIMEILLAAGADPDYMKEEYVPALHYLALNDEDYNVLAVEMLLNAGADPASEAGLDGKRMLPYRYYYDKHKADKDITTEEEKRFEQIEALLYPSYIEWLKDKMERENMEAKNETVS